MVQELFECPICCEECALVMKAPCDHEFCGTCIKRTCIEVNKKCPLCRAILPNNVDEYIFSTRLNFENFNVQQIQEIFPFVCLVGNIADVTQCVEQFGIDVNQHESLFEMTPLVVSSENGHFSIVEFLVQNGADVNQASNDGAIPLFMSSQNGHFPIVEFLVQKGADVNQVINDRRTPLLISSHNGHFPIVEFLVQNDADVNYADNNGATPILMSSQNGHFSIVEILVQNGADVNQASNNGFTPLALSIHMGHENIAELLQQHGAK